MAFKLQKNPTFTTVAKILQPTDAGQVEHTVTVRFKQVPKIADDLSVDDFLRQAILNITDVTDEEGQPVAFDATLLDQMLDAPFIKRGLIAAYWEAMAGARAGN